MAGHKPRRRRSNSKAEEVAKAMQRSASVAKEAGVDFEHLATWISLVSERTRLAPEVIGTAFQSILSRLHQIRESGYSEDGGSTNQIINALNTINQEIGTNLRLFEEDGVTWRKSQIVFEEIADSWNAMNDAQKSYITTALAGTRMQDRFLNLMDAMSDKTNGLSRYQELLGVAMESNGLTGKKYQVWLDSATAAQNRFTSATEHLYQTMGATGAIKNFYNIVAGFVSMFADGMSVTKGLPFFISGIAALVAQFVRLASSIKAAGSAFKFLATGKIGLILMGLAAASTAVNLAAGAVFGGEKKKEHRDMGDIDSDITAHSNAVTQYNEKMSAVIDKLKKIQAQYGETASSGEAYNKTIDDLISLSPQLKSALIDETGKIVDVAKALEYATQARRECRLNLCSFCNK